MVKLKYIVVFVALITQPINFAEVANAQSYGNYNYGGGFQYRFPEYQQPIPTPRENNQVSNGANNQNSLRDQKKGECADRLRKKYGYTSYAASYESFPQYLDDLISQCTKPRR